MLAHQSLIQDLVYLVVWTPVVADDMVGDGLDELRVQVVLGARLLEVRVRVGGQSLCIVNLHVRVVGSETVKSDKVDDGFFPGAEDRVVEVFNTILVVIFNLVQGTLVSHVTLPSHIWHWINL